MATVGIHLVWTCYGTWLPGDDRGHWSPLFDFYDHVIERGGKLNRADLLTHEHSRERMKESAKILDAQEMAVVVEQFAALLQEPDQPRVYAAAIEPTHVHLLFGPVVEPVGTLAGRLKGKSSSAVLALTQNQGRQRTWTAKYWKVFLFDELTLAAVQRYIEDHNVRRGMAAAPFSWIRPLPI
jgi:REP element-mobilizing transposase RayT